MNHFKKVDSVLFGAFEKVGKIEEIRARVEDEYFVSLCREIINQQLSDKVASVIFERFLKLFPKRKVTPQLILKIKDEDIRKVGTSWSKVKYIKDLASKIQTKEVKLKKLKDMNNEEAIAELIKIKGIGRWTAEMFLMFSLGREDIFSHGDLGLKNGLKKLYKIENLTLEKAEEITSKWSPYKSYGSRILWDYMDLK